MAVTKRDAGAGQATMEQRLDMGLAVRDYVNRMRETMQRIEAMTGTFAGLSAGEQVALAEVLTPGEVAEIEAIANLAQLFVADAQAAAPTFLPAAAAPELP